MLRMTDAPILKAKAYNAIVLTHWLSDVCAEARGEHDKEWTADRAGMLCGLSSFYKLLKTAGPWLTDDDLVKFRRYRNATLFLFRKLYFLCAEDGLATYRMRPKCHFWDHIERRMHRDRQNAASLWTFSDEDQMRHCLRIAQSAHGSTYEVRTLELRCCQFFTSAQLEYDSDSGDDSDVDETDVELST